MGNSLQMPGGTWKNTAVDIHFDPNSGLLVASLQTKLGSYQRDSIVATNGMVLEYDDGKFKVITKGEYSSSDLYSDVRPAGNWSETATNVRFQNNVLSASLKKANGDIQHSSIVVVDGMVVENTDGCFTVSKQTQNFASNYEKQVCNLKSQIQNLKSQVDILKSQNQTLNQTKLPLGSWVQSARKVRLSTFANISTLTAELRHTSGAFSTASYSYPSHRLPVLGNNDGSFVVDIEDCSSVIE
jgi:hypothetical protein